MNIPGQSTATRISWHAEAIPVAYCGVNNPESKFPWRCSQFVAAVEERPAPTPDVPGWEYYTPDDENDA
jgi:hypothetical protein